LAAERAPFFLPPGPQKTDHAGEGGTASMP
jgi:hypothetical protein